VSPSRVSIPSATQASSNNRSGSGLSVDVAANSATVQPFAAAVKISSSDAAKSTIDER